MGISMYQILITTRYHRSNMGGVACSIHTLSLQFDSESAANKAILNIRSARHPDYTQEVIPLY